MLLDLRPLLVQSNTGSAEYDATESSGQGSVSASSRVGNTGVYYKPRPKPAPFQLPIPEAPRHRIGGTGRVAFAGTDAHGDGMVIAYAIVGHGAAEFSPAQTVGVGGWKRHRMHGQGAASFSGTSAQGDGVYDRSHWDQIEEEDQWLQHILQALSVAA